MYVARICTLTFLLICFYYFKHIHHKFNLLHKHEANAKIEFFIHSLTIQNVSLETHQSTW